MYNYFENLCDAKSLNFNEMQLTAMHFYWC